MKKKALIIILVLFFTGMGGAILTPLLMGYTYVTLVIFKALLLTSRGMGYPLCSYNKNIYLGK